LNLGRVAGCIEIFSWFSVSEVMVVEYEVGTIVSWCHIFSFIFVLSTKMNKSKFWSHNYCMHIAN